MARGSSSSSPKVATVSQVCETGCSSRLYRILNFLEGQATKRLVSNTRHFNSKLHAIENVTSGSRPDVITTVKRKHRHDHTKVSSNRKDCFGCKSISCVKNDQVATVHQGTGATNKVVPRNFMNGKYLCKDGPISQTHQFLDALQISYSNKQLFQKLVQDQNSLSVKEQYQAGQKMLTGSAFESKCINSQRSHSTQSKWIRNFMLCRGQNDVSVHESYGRNIVRAPISPSLQKMQNTHFEDTKNRSVISNRRIVEQNNNEPPRDVVKTVKDELPYISKIVRQSPPDNINAYSEIPIVSERIIKSGYDSNPKGIRHMDVPSDQDRKDMDGPTQSFDVGSTSEGNGSVMDSPEVASSISSSSQTVEDPMNMTNMVDDHLSTEYAPEQVISEEVTNPPTAVSQTTELPIRPVKDNSEEHLSADVIKCSSDLVNNLITSTESSESDCDREILQALSLKWEELVMKSELPDQLMYPSTLEELKRLTNKLCDSTILFDYAMDVLKEKYQHLCGFPHHISIGKPNVQAYVLKRTMVHEVKEFINLHHRKHHQPTRTLEQLLGQDLDRRRSWLNVRVDIDGIATDVQEDVLQELILEIISETDTREVCDEL
ncbi:hypothetical protein QN277_028283 [Acacia crassicarpa]|uniref:DUF4378 domain-containing protein n=1 Tax=Acacia crassicarpa TaxID=499986 RepID=A0AAE1J5A3_9FABA|nr:hypothetical protein QN277_028283 [Acacia crassicarpa]